jgi:Fe-S-cluster containining protein
MINSEEKLKQLSEVYAQLPETLGCTGCGLCCMVQHPHCYYIEFVNMYNFVVNEWTVEQRYDLHYRCIENYLKNTLRKQCVFLDGERKCSVYNARDFNCRMFGAIPKKEYAKRVKKAAKRNPGVNLDLKKQSDCCKDIKPEAYIGRSKIDKLFQQIFDIDADIFSNEDLSNGNNYMTFHDHYILHYFHDKVDVLKQLTHVKQEFSEEEKTDFMKKMREESDNARK